MGGVRHAPGHRCVTSGGDRDAPDVAAYYDRNTRRFLRFGGSAGSLAIHRQLWGDGVASPREAAEHINGLLAKAIERRGLPAPTVIDLGCGVGGTLFALAERLPQSRLVGLTISAEQHRIAERLGAANGMAERIRFVHGDFERTALDVAADAIVAVEAYVHSRSAQAFFVNAARHLARDGTLIVVDDFLCAGDAGRDTAAQRTIDAFRHGWRLPSFGTVDTAVDAAGRAALHCVEQRDLTALVRLDQISRRLIAKLGPICGGLGLGRLPFFANLIGGGALHRGLASGLITYRWLRFEQTPAARNNPATARVS